MKIDRYIPEPERYREITDKNLIGLRTLLKAISARRAELRQENETAPERNDTDISRDWIFKCGQIHMCNWVDTLIDKTREYLDKIGE